MMKNRDCISIQFKGIQALLLSAIILLFGLNNSIAQTSKIGSELTVNTSTANSQQNPAIATNKYGEYIIVWESFGTDGSGYGIYGQRYNSDGTSNGSEFLVNTTTDKDQRFPSVAIDGSGNYIITWMSYDQDGSGWGVYYKVYNSSGVVMKGESSINTTTAGDQRNSDVFCNDVGSFFIVWTDVSAGGGTINVIGRTISNTGTALVAETQINTSTLASLAYPNGAMSDEGGFTIVWQSDVLDGSGMGVYGRSFDDSFVASGNDFLVNSTTSGNQQAPAIAMDSAGNFVVAWESYESGNGVYGVYARNYNASSVAQGNNYVVDASSNNTKWASICMSTNGYYTISWTTDNQDGSYAGVYAQSYELDGTALGSNTLINTTTSNFQQFSAMAQAADDTLVVVWQDGQVSGSSVDGDGYAIVAQWNQLALPIVIDLDSVDLSCNGDNSGQINSTVSGGTMPYTYAWSNGFTSANISGLSAGTYTLTVTDNIGSTETESISVSEPTAITATATTSSNVFCNGNAEGSAAVSVSGGTSPYTYSWSDGQTTMTASSLAAGTYTVTVSDANGCTISDATTVTEPTVLSTSISSQTNVDCNGNSTGSATAAGSGGTSPYTYSWSDGQTTATASSLSAGTYTISITDANGCGPSTTSVTITESTAVSASISAQANIDCNGNSTGSATAAGSGGIAPYTYNWSNGQTTATASSLSAGTWTVSIVDANGCGPALTSVSITEPSALANTISAQSNVSTNGGSDGSATASGSGGTSPYTYAWSNGATTATVTGLSAGTYTASLTDNNGCGPETATVTITEPSALTATISAQTNNLCNGGNTGSLTVSASGGVSPYTYQWNDGQIGTTASSLAAGTYTVTVTDNNAATTTTNASITEPSALVASIASQTNVSVNGGSDGAATGTASGGTSPYTYSWNNGATTATETGLIAGTYTLSITDANGCGPSTTTVIITEPSSLIVSIASQTNVDCNGNSTGSATASGSGGVAPYTYSWSNGATTASISSLASSTYTVTLTDNNGATNTTSTFITQPNVLVASISSQSNASSNGASDGSATAAGSGGTSPYTYAWSNGATTATASSLSAGTYTVSITDNNGCGPEITTATISEPAALSSMITSQTNIDCNGNANGSLTATGIGGTTPYTYQWNDGQTGTTASSLAAGTYTVTVTDNSNATATSTATITEPALLSVSTSKTDANCSSLDGTASALANGGISPYTYLWSTGGIGGTINSLAVGTYTVTVTDNNFCTATNSIQVLKDFSSCPSATNLRTLFIQDSSAQLRWDTVANARLYKVVFKPTGTSSWSQVFFRDASFPSIWNMDGLTPNTQYDWSVMTRYNDGSWSGLAPLARFTTLSSPCLIPTITSVSPLQSDKAKINWTLIPNAVIYRLQYRALGSGTWITQSVIGSRNFYWLGGLSASTTYEYRIKSVCEYGSSSGTRWSSTFNFTTDPFTAPTLFSTNEGEGKALKASIFPNPNTGQFKLFIESSDFAVKSIEVLDLRGEILYAGKADQSYEITIDLDVDHLAKGVYFLRVRSNEEQVNTRFVIQ